MEHSSERRCPNTKVEHECSGAANLAEQVLCVLKPLLLAHQEVVLSRLDQVEQSVQAVSMDLEDLRTGFKFFFDEYRIEWDDPGVTREQGHDDTRCDSQYIKASLGPVNWAETINTLSNASARSDSLSTAASNASDHGEEPRTPKPLRDGAAHSLYKAMPDSSYPPIYSPKMSPESPNRPRGLFHHFPLPTPSSSSPLIGKTNEHQLPLDLPGSPPDSSTTTTPQAIAFEQDLQLPTSSEDIAAPMSPLSTVLPHTPSTGLSTNSGPASSSPSTGDEDQMFSRFLNNEAMYASGREPAISPLARPSAFSEQTTSAIPQPAREQSIGSSEYDALATESLLFGSEHSLIRTSVHSEQHPSTGVVPYVGLTKAEIQASMGTVDPTHISTLSPLSSLSSLSPSPEPQIHTQIHISAPVQNTKMKLTLKLNSTRRKSAATTRIRKRKPRERNEAITYEGSEPPTKRFKSSGLAEMDEATMAAIQAIVWPVKPEADNGFLRKVIRCDTCKHWYHYGCVGIPDKEDKRLKRREVFMCPVCEVHPDSALKRRPKKGKDSTICARHDCNRQQTESEFHVSGIIGRRNINADADGTSYRWLIKWSGYPANESTWETDDAISDPELLIRSFYQMVKREKGLDFDLSVKEPVLLKEAVKAGWW